MDPVEIIDAPAPDADGVQRLIALAARIIARHLDETARQGLQSEQAQPADKAA